MSKIQIDGFCPVGIGGTKGIDTSQLKLFVGGLSPKQRSKDLFETFAKYGTIREAVVIPDRFRVRSKCYGFVIFKDKKSVSKVFASLPMETKDGKPMTVVLASTNCKPRRARFNVKHGVVGHKQLVENKNDNSVYSDSSLFRTANIQQIEPAKLYITQSDKKKQKEAPNGWPNDEIGKDYRNLRKMKVRKHKNKNNENNDDEDVKSNLKVHSPKKWVKVQKKNNFAVGDEDDDRLTYKSTNATPKKSDLNELNNAFKRKMQTKIVIKKGYGFGGDVNPWNGTWSPYRPRFPSNGNKQYGCDDYNMIAPTPPRQPVNDQKTESMQDKNVQY